MSESYPFQSCCQFVTSTNIYLRVVLTLERPGKLMHSIKVNAQNPTQRDPGLKDVTSCRSPDYLIDTISRLAILSHLHWGVQVIRSQASSLPPDRST